VVVVEAHVNAPGVMTETSGFICQLCDFFFGVQVIVLLGHSGLFSSELLEIARFVPTVQAEDCNR